MKRICLFNYSLGRLQDSFMDFARRCSSIKCADFFVLTADPAYEEWQQWLNEENFNNIFVVKLDLENFQQIMSDKIGEVYQLSCPEKIGDWKCTYGHLFDAISFRYEFWGYFDLDLAFGDLDKCLDGYATMDRYNIISASQTGLCNFFTIYRDRYIYQAEESWRFILTDDKIHDYIENQLDKAVKTAEENICLGVGKFFHFDEIIMDGRGKDATWENGKLTCEETGKEIMLCNAGEINVLPKGNG